MIRLEPITPDNWRLGLRVREDQREFVSDSAGMLARAYAYRDSRSQAFVIYSDEGVVVGLRLGKMTNALMEQREWRLAGCCLAHVLQFLLLALTNNR